MTVAVAERLRCLREEMQKQAIDAYIVPTADAHGSEYPSTADARREYLTGFTGSAGVAVVTPTQALLWTDGRYFIQANQELDKAYWTLMKQGQPETPTITNWLKAQHNVTVIGYDPLLTSVSFYQHLSSMCEKCSPPKTLKSVPQNLVDAIWAPETHPVPPRTKIFMLPASVTGVTTETKIANLRKDFEKQEVHGCVLAHLDEVAWVTNMRASDIECCPVFLAYMLITTEEARLYVDASRLPEDCRKVLQENKIKIAAYNGIFEDLKALYGCPAGEKKRLWLDSEANVRLYESVGNPKSQILLKMSPVQLPKAVKSPEEIEGMKLAHLKDAAAKISYLAELEMLATRTPEKLNQYTEFTAAQILDGFRKAMPDSLGLSFPTISCIGPNGAIIHYKPNADTASKLSPSLYLVDSGGQYLQGTTDVTRTIHLGTPSVEEKECWTRVLKGHLLLQRQKFPKGTKGPQLDVLARQFLWDVGLTYAHSTGHGVGSVLNVHEGPHMISPVSRTHVSKSHTRILEKDVVRMRLLYMPNQGAGILKTPLHWLLEVNRMTSRNRFYLPKGPDTEVSLRMGMVVSNEPGYYKDGSFGVRIENLVYVKQCEQLSPSQTMCFYTFEDLTLIPYQKKLMDMKLLTQQEIAQINAYHARVWSEVSPRLKEWSTILPHVEETLAWLKEATTPISSTV